MMVKRKIAIIIAFNGFRDEEFLIPYEKLKDKYHVDVYSSEIGVATGKLGAVFNVEKNYRNLEAIKYDLIMFVGGPGGYSYLGDPIIKNIILTAYSNQKWLAAICMAPLILAENGLLKDRNSTVFMGDKDKLINYGAIYTGNNVEVSDNIITADGPLSSEKFADMIINKLH
ncbi:MAG: hypothetical protein A2Y40_10740 [Candidatus Margulisbacteria bacterium GWF2_35_9]|nr:MAG: hypothetical protein A2Y40_10740 [Candidatus Margulisbacteria bacterium GWF2_35_9]